ncbi:MAG: YCF48-related protein [Planctomycetota bacterium]
MITKTLISSLTIVAWFGCNLLAQNSKVWQLQETKVQASLRGLCVVDDQIVWASGTAGTVIKTTNQGQQWSHCSIESASELDFRDIHAWNEKRALVVSAGQPARIYRTEDGGQNWQLVFEHPNQMAFFDAVSFWDEKNGIAMSDPTNGRILLIVTKDGGKTWNELDFEYRPIAMRGEGGFAASGTNMAISNSRCLIALGSAEENQNENSSRIIYSDDKGLHWNTANAPITRDPSSGIFSIAFANDGHGVAVGGNYLKPNLKNSNVAITTDRGLTWKRPSGSPPRGYRSGVAACNRSEGKHFVAVGPDGTDISSDRGNHWTPASDTGFHAVGFTKNGSIGWASGSDGRVAKWVGDLDQ